MVEIVHLSITVSSAAQNFDASSCWDCRSISLKFCHDVAHNPNAFKSLQPLLRLLDYSRDNVSCRVAQWMSSRVTLISPVYRVTINLGSQAASWHSLPSFLQDYPPYLVASMTAWNDVVVPWALFSFHWAWTAEKACVLYWRDVDAGPGIACALLLGYA